MTRNPSQREVTGFLLGLGIGLIVGIVCQPRWDDPGARTRSRGLPHPHTASGTLPKAQLAQPLS